jgi:hypothetical protein
MGPAYKWYSSQCFREGKIVNDPALRVAILFRTLSSELVLGFAESNFFYGYASLLYEFPVIFNSLERQGCNGYLITSSCISLYKDYMSFIISACSSAIDYTTISYSLSLMAWLWVSSSLNGIHVLHVSSRQGQMKLLFLHNCKCD